MMSRTYHLLVLTIFAGFLVSTTGLARDATASLARGAATATTATYTRIIAFILLFITHFGCPPLKVCIEAIIAISHGSAIIGSTIIGSAIIGSTIIGSAIVSK